VEIYGVYVSSSFFYYMCVDILTKIFVNKQDKIAREDLRFSCSFILTLNKNILYTTSVVFRPKRHHIIKPK